VIYSISGKFIIKRDNFIVLDIGGLAFKIFTNKRTLEEHKDVGGDVKFFTHLNVKEDALDLYGFFNQEELRFFELLISVSGVGPKSALSILDIAELNNLSAAIKEGRPDLMTRASGIGRKTAERIILELRGKVESDKSEATVKKMEHDSDLVETLVSLGYRKDQARVALNKVPETVMTLDGRIKVALRILSGKED
jgi:holliday junction DNA helicase RuvA